MEYKTNYDGMSVVTTTHESDNDSTKTFRDEGTGEVLAHYRKAGGELLLTGKGSARLPDISFYLEHYCGLVVVKINKT